MVGLICTGVLLEKISRACFQKIDDQPLVLKEDVTSTRQIIASVRYTPNAVIAYSFDFDALAIQGVSENY